MTRQARGLLLAALALSGLVLACAPAAAPESKPPPAAAATPLPAAQAAATAAPPAAAAPAAAPQAQASPGQRVTVRMGGIAGVIDRALWTGEAKGFYQEQGIALEIENFTTTVDMVAPLATGRLDAGHGALNAGIYNAVATGVPIKVVSNMTIIRPPAEGVRNSYQIVIRKDLAGQVRSVPDLRGMRLAINAPAAQVHAWRALSHYGLQLDDVQLENVTFPEMVAALANQAIDAALMLEPFITLGQERGVLEPLLDMGQAMPNYPVSQVFFTADFIQSQPEAARRFLVAYTKALRYLEDATTKRQNWNEVVQLMVANTAVKDPALYDRMADSYSETDANVGVDALEVDQDFYVQAGMQREKVNMRDLVDPRFGEYVVSVLGRYQR
jgi:NitT/TauT family transport system substrate-binding protein